MAHTLTEAMDSRRRSAIHFEATCYKITRLDGVILHLTDAQEPLVLADGQTYSPAGGFNVSSRRKVSNLEDQHFDGGGVLTSDVITNEDMRAGRYIGAMVETFLVDFRTPWAGHFQHLVAWISKTKYDNEVWKAEVEGFTSKLKQEVGDDAATTCKWDLADAFFTPTKVGCKADLGGLGFKFNSHAVQFLDVTEPKRRFIGTDVVLIGDVFQFGKITWLTGPNAGLVSKIRGHTDFGGATLFELYLELPTAPGIGDTYDVEAGCNKLAGVLTSDVAGHCVHKFNQLVNFGGDPYLPGTGRVVRVPI